MVLAPVLKKPSIVVAVLFVPPGTAIEAREQSRVEAEEPDRNDGADSHRKG